MGRTPAVHAFLPTPRIDGRLAGAAAVSASLRLEDLHRRSHTRPLLRLPTSQVLFGSKAIHWINNAWCRGAFFHKSGACIKAFCDKLLADRASFSHLFSGKQDENQFLNKWVLSSRTSRRNFVNGRLWSTIRLATNVGFCCTDGHWGEADPSINSLILEGQLWRLVTSAFLHANIGHLLVTCYSLNSVGPIVEKVDPQDFLRFTSCLFSQVIGIASKGVDNWGHLGGLLGGAAMSWFLGPAWTYKYKSRDG